MLRVSPLFFWCHKVIPLVYDDALSYYELVHKVAWKLNELISNMNDLPDAIKEEIANALKDNDTLQDIIDSILSGDNIALRSDLTSNDIDINTAYTLYYTKTEPYKTMQCFAHLDNGGYSAVFAKSDRIHYIIRRMSEEWEQVGSQSAEFTGHGNDCASNGSNRIYVLSSYVYDNVEYDNGLIRAIKYPELTEVSGESFVVKYGGVPIKINSFCYDRDLHKFYCMKGNDVYVYADNSEHTFLEHFILNDNMSTVYHDQYPRMAEQGSSYYNGMIVRFYAYPNMIAFFDVKTHDLVKVYTIPYKSEIGNALTELECGCFNGKDLYVSSFQRDNDQGLATHTNCGAWNTLLKLNFWTNVPKGYQQKANEYANHNVYIDGSTTNNKHYGTLQYPYRTLSEAMSTLHSPLSVEQPLNLLCRAGTNVGILRGSAFPAFRLNVYTLDGDTDTKFDMYGVDIDYSTFQIYNARIHRNNATSTGGVSGTVMFPNTADVRFCDAYFGYCDFDAPYDNTAYGLCVNSGRVTLRQNTFISVSGGYCVYGGTEAEITEDSNTFNGASLKLDAGCIFNRSGKVSAIDNKIAGGSLIPVNRFIIFNGEATEVGEYSLNANVDLSGFTLKRCAIVTLRHNTGYTEFPCFLSGTDAFCQPQAITVTSGGVAQIHYIGLHIHFDTNKINITSNKTVKVSDGTVYNQGTSATGIQYATITRIELV